MTFKRFSGRKTIVLPFFEFERPLIAFFFDRETIRTHELQFYRLDHRQWTKCSRRVYNFQKDQAISFDLGRSPLTMKDDPLIHSQKRRNLNSETMEKIKGSHFELQVLHDA